MNSNTKQVIVMRKDLKMRRGKEIAQGSHASISFLVKRLEYAEKMLNAHSYHGPLFSKAEHQWIEGSFTKVCLQVNSEQELLDIHQKALDAGLVSHLITDAGRTEFNGVPTITCCAIGPDIDDRINPITGHLTLY